MLDSPDVESSKAYLEANGVPVFTDIERHGEMAFFTVKDPDENVIMICSEAENYNDIGHQSGTGRIFCF
jgi:hypothetical protein